MATLANKQRQEQLSAWRFVRLAIKLVVGFVLVSLVIVVAAANMAASSKGVPVTDMLPVVQAHLGELISILLLVPLEVFGKFLLIMLLDVVTHEGGHLLAGRLVGFRFVMVILGPLTIEATGHGPRLRWTDKSTSKMGGGALSVPTTWHNLRWRTAAMVVGGPLGNLVLGVVLVALASATSGGWHDFFELAAFVTFFLTIANLVPMKVGGAMLDGARLSLLLAGGPKADRYCFMTALSGASRSGQRPRDWDPEWVRQMSSIMDGSLDDASASHAAFYWALDRGDVASADAFLNRLLASVEALPAHLRPLVFADPALFHAYFHKKASTARSFLEKAGSAAEGRYRYMYFRALSAVLLVEGKGDEARQAAREGLAELEREAPRGPGWELDQEWMQALAA